MPDSDPARSPVFPAERTKELSSTRSDCPGGSVANWLHCELIKLLHYVSEDGADHFDRWFRNQSSTARARIQTRIDRVELDNFGDHKSVARGVYELRIDFGSGYRVSY